MEKINSLLTNIEKHKTLVVALSAVVVFVTTYMLILPALTLDQEEAEGQGGIDIVATQSAESTAVEQGDEVTAKDKDTDSDTKNDTGNQSSSTAADAKESVTAGTLTFDTDGYKVALDFDKKAKLPKGTELEAVELSEEDKDFEYDVYVEKALEAVKDQLGEDKVSGLQLTKLYDITLLSDGQEIEPQGAVDVTIDYDKKPEIKGDGVAQIVHFTEDKKGKITATLVDEKDMDVTVKKEKLQQVKFTADAFSIYAVVYTLEYEFDGGSLVGSGNTYKITVTYDDSAEIPAGSRLKVSEIGETSKEYDQYLEETEKLVGYESGSLSYARFFDISILDQDGKEVQPAEGAYVSVDVSLEDANKDAALQVVHFGETSEVLDAQTKGNTVSFETTGFSAYAIVQGPEAIPLGWSKISTIEELKSYAEKGIGLYVGHTDGYYFTDGITNISANRTGITKTKPTNAYPVTGEGKAVKYYFEFVDGTDSFKVYCGENDEKTYVGQTGNSLFFTDDEGSANVFTIEKYGNNANTFRIKGNDGFYWNMQGGASGASFAAYNSAGDGNNKLYFWRYETTDKDPYDLDGKSYGLMNWAGGVAGKALMADSSAANTLDAKALTVMSTANNSSQLFVPNDSEISMWTFHWISDDTYYISTVADGSTKYLKIDANGLRLVSEKSDASEIQVIPGAGTHNGEICLKSGTNTLTFSGTVADGFSINGTVGNEWLNLVELSELTTDYFLTYSAQKVSVSDESITNGSRVIVYTRSWNEEKLKYDYFAISSDGSLVPVYESGDSIEWVSGQINTLLWNFVEYYWEGTTDPNNYYELFNQYSEKYIAPQITGNQILSDDTIGINLNGRRDGQYYSTILAWDEGNYSYVGLKVEDGKIVTCPKSEAMDFYFAVMQDMNVDDTLTTVPTVDHTQFGITMKIVNFGGKTGSHDGGSTSTEEQYAVIGDGSYTQNAQKSGLLSTNLDENGYPTAVKTSKSLQELFKNAQEVNHLFIGSTYNGTGYYEYDSTQNFATLTDSGDFRVYKELGTMDGDNKNTLKHGQFMPFNDLEAGVFASVNGKNLYSAVAKQLADSDPRKYEQMYLVRNPNYYYGVELEASFTQTPSGLDAWGHDIIYEFTGDDDFWLYVDGELVIDLGGIHGALPGSVNFRTGEVVVNGTTTTLRELFESNYRGRNPEASNEAVAAFLAQYFDEGSTVFKDDTTHTMRIFYMERGAGAANLHMRFNLAAVKKGTVQLTKTLAGVDEEDILAEFPYQIRYKKEDGTEHLLTNAIADSLQNDDYVLYKDTVNPVKYAESITIDGKEYKDVFFLKPGETADISFPEGMTSYRIVECGVNTEVYKSVTVNKRALDGTTVEGSSNRKDYEIDYDTTDNRAKVHYVNEVNPEALRTLTITKKLYEADGITPIHYEANDTEFTFRMYLASEFSDLDVANMQTYHVKDPDGNYCQWDSRAKKFVKIGEGKTNFADLDDAQKDAASFTTSIYGTIGRLPADFTVEFRDVLAGTKYRVEERPHEIPDGYSFQKYDGYDKVHANVVERGNTGITGVNGTVVSGKDAPVVVCNLKGWGLRVNKVWSDEDYMSSRDDTYFALFTKDSDSNLTLVPDSVRQMAYDSNPQTIYWYYDKLPVSGTSGLEDYLIREVKLEVASGQSIEVNEDGAVTGFGSVIPIGDDGQIDLNGTQKGETSSSQFTYQVQYEEGEISSYSNVRVDTVTNDRPGVILKKQDWSGQPLKGATFTLETDETTIGTFTSGEDGLITTAFLSNGKDYILTETTSPQGYHGLEEAMTICENNGVVSVSGPDETSYSLTQAQGTTPATLVIKNRPFSFQAVKKDGDTNAAMAGVEFALHRQVTVGGVTAIDLNPMPGYESLKTDENGVIPQIDKTLPAGLYELREKKTLDGYEMLNDYIQFSISPTGKIILGTHPQDVALTGTPDQDGVLEYVLTIPNYKTHREFTFTKVWRDSVGNATISWPDEKSITVSILQAKGQSDSEPSVYATYTIRQSNVATLNTEIGATGEDTLPKLKVTGNSKEAYTFTLEGLPATESESGKTVNYVYYVSEPEAVAGFQSAKYFIGEEQAMGASRIGSGGTICNDQIGYELPSAGGFGTHWMYMLGALLLLTGGVLLIARRRMRV